MQLGLDVQTPGLGPKTYITIYNLLSWPYVYLRRYRHVWNDLSVSLYTNSVIISHNRAVRHIMSEDDRIRTTKMAEAISEHRNWDMWSEVRRIKGRNKLNNF